jgi:hypothetical protein
MAIAELASFMVISLNLRDYCDQHNGPSRASIDRALSATYATRHPRHEVPKLGKRDLSIGNAPIDHASKQFHIHIPARNDDSHSLAKARAMRLLEKRYADSPGAFGDPAFGEKQLAHCGGDFGLGDKHDFIDECANHRKRETIVKADSAAE